MRETGPAIDDGRMAPRQAKGESEAERGRISHPPLVGPGAGNLTQRGAAYNTQMSPVVSSGRGYASSTRHS